METLHPLPDNRTDLSEYLTPTQAGQESNLTESTLATKRSRGNGPAYIKRNGKVFYRRGDLLKWLEQRTTQHGEVAR